jgi:hypothetical protein
MMRTWPIKRPICDLFGVTIATAQHYTSTLSHPALRDADLADNGRRPSGR